MKVNETHTKHGFTNPNIIRQFKWTCIATSKLIHMPIIMYMIEGDKEANASILKIHIKPVEIYVT